MQHLSFYRPALLAMALLASAGMTMQASARPEAEFQDDFGHNARQGRPLIVAHRGASGLRVENSLSAFRKALELGADGLETDVQLTADGQLVLNHDFTLNADLAQKNGSYSAPQTPIKSMMLADIRSYDIGTPKPGTAYAARHPDLVPTPGEKVPTLAELIDLMRAHDDRSILWLEIKSMPFMPEVSGDPVQLAQSVVDTLHAQDFTARVVVLSFDWNVLREVKKRDPSIPLAFLSSNVHRALAHAENSPLARADPAMITRSMTGLNGFNGRSIVDVLKEEGAAWWDQDYADFTLHDLTEAQEQGLRLGAWTLDDPGTARLLFNIGIDAITTNRPDIMFEEFDPQVTTPE
ncbi:glycerophosphodiester phosphodiesterase family protein [Altericroceibacterium spongiae]|uniref:glycerophosphodiester phosphodiesterase family protein n=1 Tax=Altericroceibacterium spongiae TaxID=2320269 RepID=UPI0015FF22CD|nr:glycerophosphodiester phosphodiesterase family protein [Altericroceibacterium spongiae]